MLDFHSEIIDSKLSQLQGYFRQLCNNLCFPKIPLVPETKKESIADILC